MSGKRPEPPAEGAWTRSIAEVNAETEARAEAAGVEAVRGAPVPHAAHLHPDLWQTWQDVLDRLDGDAAERLRDTLSDPLSAEALVGAVATWEILDDDPVAVYRAREGIEDRRFDRTRLRDVREALDKLPDYYMAGMIPDLFAAALAVESRPDAPQGHEVRQAARKAASALADLRALVVQAEAAAPKARGGQPKAETQARERLFDNVRRALDCPDDAAFEETRRALWEALTGEEELPDY